MSCWLTHSWEPWHPYTHKYSKYDYVIQREVGPFFDLRERRRCILCGKTQDRLVAECVPALAPREGER